MRVYDDRYMSHIFQANDCGGHIDTIRIWPDGQFPIGGAYNLAATITATGVFNDYGTQRCRFTSALAGVAGGEFIGTQGIVHNRTFLTCEKPRFPGWTRDLANRYDLAFSPNGQCFRMNIPPRGANAFYATNTHVTRISPVGFDS